jgi:hypothetical protein
MMLPIVTGNAVSAQNAVVVSSSAATYMCPKCGKLHYRQPVNVSPAADASVTTTPAAATSATTVQASPATTVQASPATTVQASPATGTVRTVSFEAASAPMASSSAIRATSGVSNVLGALNAQRARRGIRALMFDPVLQAVAQRRAQRMAASGLKNHPPGSFAPGRYEGVGWSSSYSPSGVSACFTSDTRMRYAGAAMATGRDGVYFAVVYR